MIILPSSFPPRGATSIASVSGNCARIDKQVLADPPRVRATECARTAEAGSGWLARDSVWVRNSVPHATTRTVRWFVEFGGISGVSRRSRAMPGAMVAGVYKVVGRVASSPKTPVS